MTWCTSISGFNAADSFVFEAEQAEVPAGQFFESDVALLSALGQQVLDLLK
jgi:hypothetical protein